MSRNLVILFAMLALISCGTRTIIFEPYSTTPIAVDCAYESILSMGAYDFVEKKENEITFFSKSVSGSLFHGGAASFKNYGLELQTTQPLGPNVEEVSGQLVDKINADCSNKGV